MLRVINVGQGDSFLFTPRNCILGDQSLLIDTGEAKAKISESIDSKIKYTVMITHSHRDHMGGLPALMRKGMVNELILPYYLPEVTKIASFLKGKFSSKISTPDWRVIRKLRVRLVSEGDKLCANHDIVLNPPKGVDDINFPEPQESAGEQILGALAFLREIGINLPEDKIVNYSSPIQPEDDAEYQQSSREFVHRFFIGLARDLQGHGKVDYSYYISRHLELTSNQASIVFKHSSNNTSWLFTGDADELVFSRLIKKNQDISADILKVPHHGSRENLSGGTLSKISPKYAIISHGNRRFGRSSDTHPHHEVIDLLDKFGVKSFYTNAVVKKGSKIKNGTVGVVLPNILEFI